VVPLAQLSAALSDGNGKMFDNLDKLTEREILQRLFFSKIVSGLLCALMGGLLCAAFFFSHSVLNDVPYDSSWIVKSVLGSWVVGMIAPR